MPKLTKLQREVKRLQGQRLRRARQELAARLPDERSEIMAGEYDQGAGMQSVLKDLDIVHGRVGGAHR